METCHEEEIAPGLTAIRPLEARLRLLMDRGYPMSEAVALILNEDRARRVEIKRLHKQHWEELYSSRHPRTPVVRFWNDPKVVENTPIVTTALLEMANAGQLLQMWSRKTAAGQNLWGWLSVWAALILWCRFYRICCPEQKKAYYFTCFGVFMNTLVWLTVLYFRMTGRG